jgi:hypothetical protein
MHASLAQLYTSAKAGWSLGPLVLEVDWPNLPGSSTTATTDILGQGMQQVFPGCNIKLPHQAAACTGCTLGTLRLPQWHVHRAVLSSWQFKL